MLNRKAFLSGVGGLIVLAMGAFAVNAANSERADCPGKVVCPINGETICKDECPLIDPNRPDCPGKIGCPITGEMICKDQCPVGDIDDAAECCESSCCSDGTVAKD